MSHFTIRRLAPLAGLLFVLASGAARAQFPSAPSPSNPAPAYTAQCGDYQSAVVYSGSDQGTYLVQGPSQVQTYGQALAGSTWSFQEMQSKNGVSIGRVTLSKGGQQLLAQPGMYSSQMSSDGNSQHYDVYYSSSKLILYASVTYYPKSPKDSSAQVQYTSLSTSSGSYGTPYSAHVYYPMTFTPYTPTPTPSGY